MLSCGNSDCSFHLNLLFEELVVFDRALNHGSPLEWEEEASIDLQPKADKPGLALTIDEYHDLLASFRAEVPKMQHVEFTDEL